MIITVKNKDGERQKPIVTIDTETCHYPYAIREAIELALMLKRKRKALNKACVKRAVCPYDDFACRVYQFCGTDKCAKRAELFRQTGA